MRNLDTPESRARTYHKLSIGSHWLTVVLLIAIYALIELRGLYSKGSEARDLMKVWHEMLGMIVFGLAFIRLELRALYPAPQITLPPPLWQDTLARAMHVTLYAFLIGMPLLGWMMLGAKGKPIPFFGLELPALMRPDRAAATTIEGLHALIGNVGYGLIGLHAAAALWHHHIMRDDTLHHMWPPAGPRLPVGPTRAPGDRKGGAIRRSRSSAADRLIADLSMISSAACENAASSHAASAGRPSVGRDAPLPPASRA